MKDEFEKARDEAVVKALRRLNRLDDRHTEEGLQIGWNEAYEWSREKFDRCASCIVTTNRKEMYAEKSDRQTRIIEELEGALSKIDLFELEAADKTYLLLQIEGFKELARDTLVKVKEMEKK